MTDTTRDVAPSDHQIISDASPDQTFLSRLIPRWLTARVNDTPFLVKLLAPLVLSFIAFTATTAILWRQVELSLGALTEISQTALVGNAKISQIVDHIDNLNGQLYRHFSEMLADQEPSDTAVIKELVDELQVTVGQLKAYQHDYADAQTSAEIDKALEDLKLYGDALGFVDNMLQVDTTAAVSFIRPFDQNYRSLRTRLTSLLDNAVTRSQAAVELRRAEAHESRRQLIFGIALGMAAILVLGLATILGMRRSILTLARSTLDIANGDTALELGRLARKDELGAIVTSLEVFQANRRELDRYREELELLVKERTSALEQANVELTYTLDALREAQSELVEQEKFASLGGMVAGIAHEVNTPLGICVTGASMLTERLARISAAYQAGTLDEADFARFLSDATETSDLLASNLARAAGLIRSFKQIAADQTQEEPREIELGAYVRDITSSLQAELRKAGHEIRVECPDPVLITLQPSAIWQILSNLVMNSILHGYGEGEAGQFAILIEREQRFVRIVYSDDGRGMSEDVRAHIFEPFFTTKRGTGGTGLGLSIVYTLIKNILSGTIDCRSAPGEGTIFTIQIPLR